jgi:hypothetical protein
MSKMNRPKLPHPMNRSFIAAPTSRISNGRVGRVANHPDVLKDEEGSREKRGQSSHSRAKYE